MSNCICHPAHRCGRCPDATADEPYADIATAALLWAESEASPLPNARRDDETWNERVRRVAEMNEGAAVGEEEEAA